MHAAGQKCSSLCTRFSYYTLTRTPISLRMVGYCTLANLVHFSQKKLLPILLPLCLSLVLAASFYPSCEPVRRGERGEDCMHSRMDAHADASGVFFFVKACLHALHYITAGPPHPHGKQGCKKLQISCNLSDHCNLYTHLLGLWHWYYRSHWWRG
jgi:hypothetical protein